MKNWKKIISFTLVLCSLMLLYIGNIAYAVDDYEAWSNNNGVSTEIYVKERNSDVQWVAYCFDVTKDYPINSRTETTPYPSRVQGTLENIRTYSQNKNIELNKIKSVLYNGYPFDSAGIQRRNNISDALFRKLTQYAVWVNSNNVKRDELNDTENKIVDEILESPAAPDTFGASIYIPKSGIVGYNGKPIQELIVADGATQRIPTFTIGFVKQEKTNNNANFYNPNISGGTFRITRDSENGEVVHEWENDGKRYEVGGLRPGTYHFVEVKSPEGYKLYEENGVPQRSTKFMIDRGGNLHVFYDNKWTASENFVGMYPRTVWLWNIPAAGYNDIFISKVTPELNELPNAIISILNENGSIVLHNITSTDKPTKIKLKDGIYQFKEETAPNGYLKVKDFKFRVTSGSVTIEDNGGNKADLLVVNKNRLTVIDTQKPEFKVGTLKTTVSVGGKKATASAPVKLTVDEVARNIEIVDTVDYTDLVVGEQYKLTGTLMEVSETGEAREVKNVAPVFKNFTPAKANGTETITFRDVKLDPNKKYVVFEKAESTKEIDFRDGNRKKHEIEHFKADDIAQTIVVEKVKPEVNTGTLKTTVSVDKKKATENAPVTLTALEVAENKTVVDTVDYTGLVVGEEYQLTGTLMEVLANGNTKAVEGVNPVVQNFTPTKPDGTETITFNNVKLKPNTKYVVFEKAETLKEIEFKDGSRSKHKIEHFNAKDTAQTIVVEREKPAYNNPSIKTVAKVDNMEASDLAEIKITTDLAVEFKDVVDKVIYKGFIVGKEYNLTATLMEVLPDGSTTPVVVVGPANKTFTATRESGTEEVTIKNVRLEAGKKYVVFEEAESVETIEFNDGTTRKHTAEHKDATAKSQTIIVEKTVVEKPEYSDGILRTTVSIDGRTATETEPVKLTAEEAKTPKNVVDKIDYEGLKVGKQYQLTGTLMEVLDGKNTKKVDGVEPVVHTFTPKAENGTETITFENVTLEAGKTYVVYEEAESVDELEFKDGNKKHRAEHKDATDKKQTVVVENVVIPKPDFKVGTLKTTVSIGDKKATKDAPVNLTAEEVATTKDVVDTVDYTDLLVGERYKLTGTLMEVLDGGQTKKVEGVEPVVHEFTPNKPNGIETITFSGVKLEPGKTYVVFEKAETLNEIEFSDGSKKKHEIEHFNADDKAQTIITENKTTEKPEYSDGKLRTTVSIDGRTATETEPVRLTAEEAKTPKNVVDKIDYEGLKAGKQYKLTGTLMVVENGNATAVPNVKSVVKMFTPQEANGTETITFENVTLEAGKTYVVYEEAESVEELEFKEGNKKHKAEHKDATDKKQTVVVSETIVTPKPDYNNPSIKTVVKVDNMEANDLAEVKITTDLAVEFKDVVDKVIYKGFIVGKQYKLTGTLMEVLPDGNTTPVVIVGPVEKTFTADNESGTEEVTFKNVRLETGKKYVVFEEVESVETIEFNDGTTRKHTAEHKDATAKSQTIIVEKTVVEKPEYSNGILRTTVSIDDKTATEQEPVRLTAEEAKTPKNVVDKIDYEGLKAGKQYKLTGTLMEVENGNATAVPNVKAVVKMFTPVEANGTETITFENVTLEAGKTYVVYEEAESVDELEFKDGNKKHRAEHKDATDKKQTVVVENVVIPKPDFKVGTLKTTVSIGDKKATKDAPVNLTAEEVATAKDVVDTVDYTDLLVGEKYKLIGTLMVVEGGKATAVEGVQPVVHEFTPNEPNGTETITFTGVKLEPGKTYVVYEKAETLKEIEFSDGSIKKHEIEHFNADDKAQTIITENKTTEKPEYSDGILRTTVSIDGRTATEQEPVRLTAEEAKTPKNVVDKIDYEGLKAGKQYKLTGTLMVVENGNATAVPNVKAVVKMFTPQEANGTETITFENVTLEAGKTYVVYEEAESVDELEFKDGNKKHRAEHKDATDKKQTVVVENKTVEKPAYNNPSIKTVVKVDNMEANDLAEVKITTDLAVEFKDVVDKVIYKGFIVGKQYKLTGTLMEVLPDGSTTPVVIVGPVTKNFVAENESGTEEITFKNVILEAGKKYVVFEEVESVETIEFNDGTTRKHTAEHKDATAKSQTIIVEKTVVEKPEYSDGKLRTTVTVDGRTATETEPVKLTAEEVKTPKNIVDRIDYEGLKAGKEYKLTGTLMLVENGKATPVQGVAPVVKNFTPNEANGFEEITFENVTLDAGKTYVVYEEAESVEELEFKEGNKKHKAEHKEATDKKQTVVVEKAKNNDGNNGNNNPNNNGSIKPDSIYKKVVFSKRSSLNVGEELPGAHIVITNEDGTVAKIYDSNMNVIEGGAWISGETEKIIYMEAGTYIFHEEVSPDNHLKVTDVKFKVDSEGNVFILDLGENSGEHIILKGDKIIVIDEAVYFIEPDYNENDGPNRENNSSKHNKKNKKLVKTGHGIGTLAFSGMASTIGLAYIVLKKKKRNK